MTREELLERKIVQLKRRLKALQRNTRSRNRTTPAPRTRAPQAIPEGFAVQGLQGRINNAAPAGRAALMWRNGELVPF